MRSSEVLLRSRKYSGTKVGAKLALAQSDGNGFRDFRVEANGRFGNAGNFAGISFAACDSPLDRL
jgi:hypothetical protein